MERGCGGQVGEKGREGVRREDRRRDKDICKLSGVTSKSTHPMLKAPPSPTPFKTNYLSRVLFLGAHQWASFITFAETQLVHSSSCCSGWWFSLFCSEGLGSTISEHLCVSICSHLSLCDWLRSHASHDF